MCLGIPGQVIRMLDGYGDQLALVDVAGENRKVNIGMLPEEKALPSTPVAFLNLDNKDANDATPLAQSQLPAGGSGTGGRVFRSHSFRASCC